MAEAERHRLERLFASHDAPADGYAVRDVVLFGLSEIARARKCLDLLRRNDAKTLGRLMTLSHDGDRVSRETARHTWRRVSPRVTDRECIIMRRGRNYRDLSARTRAFAGAGSHVTARHSQVEGAQLRSAVPRRLHHGFSSELTQEVGSR
jgi:hypothetical protein